MTPGPDHAWESLPHRVETALAGGDELSDDACATIELGLAGIEDLAGDVLGRAGYPKRLGLFARDGGGAWVELANPPAAWPAWAVALSIHPRYPADSRDQTVTARAARVLERVRDARRGLVQRDRDVWVPAVVIAVSEARRLRSELPTWEAGTEPERIAEIEAMQPEAVENAGRMWLGTGNTLELFEAFLSSRPDQPLPEWLRSDLSALLMNVLRLRVEVQNGRMSAAVAVQRCAAALGLARPGWNAFTEARRDNAAAVTALDLETISGMVGKREAAVEQLAAERGVDRSTVFRELRRARKSGRVVE